MIISAVLAQRIVDAAICAVPCNVNIMDRDGIILATAQPDRLGTVHSGARHVVESGGAVEIGLDQIGRYPGAREGVNLPIIFDEQIIGVVGVTGDPEQIRSIARLAKTITELILEQEQLRQELGNRQRLSEHLLELLLWGGTPLPRPRILRSFKALGLDPARPRFVGVADVTPLITGFQAVYGGAELIIDRVAEAIQQGLDQDGTLTPEDLSVVLDQRLIVLKTAAGDDESIRPWCEGIAARLHGLFGTPVVLGAGALARHLEDYAASYRQALFCLNAGSPEPARVIHDHSLAAGYLLHEMAIHPAAAVLRPGEARLHRYLERKPEARASLMALLANNLEPDATAYALGIHRNTLNYRMERLRALTGLDPMHRYEDALLIRLMLERRDG